MQRGERSEKNSQIQLLALGMFLLLLEAEITWLLQSSSRKKATSDKSGFFVGLFVFVFQNKTPTRRLAGERSSPTPLPHLKTGVIPVLFQSQSLFAPLPHLRPILAPVRSQWLPESSLASHDDHNRQQKSPLSHHFSPFKQHQGQNTPWGAAFPSTPTTKSHDATSTASVIQAAPQKSISTDGGTPECHRPVPPSPHIPPITSVLQGKASPDCSCPSLHRSCPNHFAKKQTGTNARAKRRKPQLPFPQPGLIGCSSRIYLQAQGGGAGLE